MLNEAFSLHHTRFNNEKDPKPTQTNYIVLYLTGMRRLIYIFILSNSA